MAVTPITTINTGEWAVFREEYPAPEYIPGALIFHASTVVSTELDGDESVVRVPWVDDSTAVIVPEGAEIPPSETVSKSAQIWTTKVANLISLSNELAGANNSVALKSFENALHRAIIRKADEVFLAQPEPDDGEQWPPPGIIHQVMTLENPILEDNLDPIALALGMIGAAGGNPEIAIMHPITWSHLAQLKQADGSNVGLLGGANSMPEGTLFGMRMIANVSMPEDKILLVDPTSIASAVSPVTFAMSDHVGFRQDSRDARFTFRFGATVMHPNRNVLVSVAPKVYGDPENPVDGEPENPEG